MHEALATSGRKSSVALGKLELYRAESSRDCCAMPVFSIPPISSQTGFDVERYRNETVYFTIAVFVLTLAVPYILRPQFLGEDALIFYRDTYLGGPFSSFTKPHAGYFSAVHRLVAAVGFVLRDEFVPSLYLGASLLILFGAAALAFRRLARFGFAFGLLGAAIVLLAPSRYEVHFSLTNAQWVLALAYLLMLAGPRETSPVVTPIVLVLLGLTGPFSIIFLPVLALRCFLLRDFRENWPFYSAVIVPAGIQGFVLATSSRQTYGPDTVASFMEFARVMLWQHPSHFIGPALDGALSAAWTWSVIGAVVILVWQKRKTEAGRSAVLLLVGAIVSYGAGLWAYKFAPGAMSPNSWVYAFASSPERYFFIPTAALLISACLVAAVTKSVVRGFLVLSVVAILALQFPFIWFSRPDFQWNSYVALSRIENDTRALIYPDWMLDRIGPRNPAPKHFSLADLNPIYFDISQTRNSAGVVWIAATNDPQVTISLPESCRPYRNVALKVQGTGFITPQTFLSKAIESFDQRRSITLPNDGRPLFFAFRKDSGIDYKMRFDVDTRPGSFLLDDFRLICY
jgi:hypothetical protein